MRAAGNALRKTGHYYYHHHHHQHYLSCTPNPHEKPLSHLVTPLILFALP